MLVTGRKMRYTHAQEIAERSIPRMKQHPYPHFAEALRAYGDSSPAIARALGVSQRSALNYLTGSALPRVQIVKRFPLLDHALTLDIPAAPVAETDQNTQEIAENSA
jgi:hypothetical protein